MLTDEQVAELIRLRKEGVPFQEGASRMGIKATRAFYEQLRESPEYPSAAVMYRGSLKRAVRARLTEIEAALDDGWSINMALKKAGLQATPRSVKYACEHDGIKAKAFKKRASLYG